MMIKSALFITALTGFLSFTSYGQVYEKIYETAPVEIQEKMNQNKMAGVDILSNIQTHHIIGISGIPVAQLPELQNLLNNDQEILSFTVNEDVTSVVIDSKAWFTKEKFTTLIQGMNAIVTGYSATYSINE